MILLPLTRLKDIHPPKSSTDEFPVSMAGPVTLTLIDDGVLWRRLVPAKALTSELHPSVDITFVHLHGIAWYFVVLHAIVWSKDYKSTSVHLLMQFIGVFSLDLPRYLGRRRGSLSLTHWPSQVDLVEVDLDPEHYL